MRISAIYVCKRVKEKLKHPRFHRRNIGKKNQELTFAVNCRCLQADQHSTRSLAREI